MTRTTPDKEVARRSTTPSWRREIIELAALFVAVAVADLFANSLAHQPVGPVVLVGMGVLLIGCAVAHRWWRQRVPTRSTSDTPVTWRVRTTVRDTPGSLAALAASLAGHRMNIASVQVHALPDGAVDELLLDVPPGTAEGEIVAATEAGGGRDVHADPVDPHELVDVPTQVLTVVGQVMRGGLELPDALRALLGDCEIHWEPAANDPAEGPDGTRLRLVDPAGGILVLHRRALVFTPAEFARARAMAGLPLPAEEPATALASGSDLTVRRARGADLPAIIAMHDRSSDLTRQRRYLTGITRPPEADLRRMIHHRHGHTLVVEAPDGAVVAMANLMWDGDTAEIALLVEDAWQRQGIGTALLHRLVKIADDAGVSHVYAVTETANTPMVSALRRLGGRMDEIEYGVAHVSIRAADLGAAETEQVRARLSEGRR